MKPWLLVLAWVLSPGLALAQNDAKALLDQALAALRGPPMAAELELAIERPGRRATYRLSIYSGGQDRSLVRVRDPARMKGQAFLISRDRIWVYDPRFRRVLELPPSGKSQSFLGSDLSFEDLAGRGFARDYSVKIGRASGDRVTLVLIPRPNAPVPYGRLELTLKAATKVPLELVYYDQRGQAVRRVRFTERAALGEGRYLITAGEVENLQRPGWRTRFRFTAFKPLDRVDPACFTPTALERGCP